MTDIEYRQDLNAYKKLYSELVSRYHSTGEKDERFELAFDNEFCFIRKVFLSQTENSEFIRIPGGTMSDALEELVRMEKALNKLSRAGK
ncbi:MAG: hypothetical protein AABX11_04500 [Nanoarchaeota archaeon]